MPSASSNRVRAARGRVGKLQRDGVSGVLPPWVSAVGLGLVAAKLLLVPLVMDPLGQDAFELPKATVSRALMFAQAGLVIVYLATCRLGLRSASVVLALGAYGLIATVAAVTALDPVAAIHGGPGRHLGLLGIMDGLTTAAAVAIFVRGRPQLLSVALVAAIGFFAVTTYQLAQIAGLDPIRWTSPSISSFVGNAAGLGGYLVVASAVLASGVAFNWPSLRRAAKVAALVLLAACVGLTFGSGARGPALAVVPTLGFAGLVGVRCRGHTKITLGSGVRPFVAVATLMVIAVGAVLASPVGSRLQRPFSPADTSVVERLVIYQTVLAAVRDRPLLGVGPDGMAAAYVSYRAPETARMEFLSQAETSTHSWVLHHLLGTGVVGFLAFTAILAFAARLGWSGATSPNGAPAMVGVAGMAAYLAQGLFSINTVVTDLLLWTSIGLVLGSTLTDGPPRLRVSVRRAGWAFLGSLTVGALLLSASLAPLEANRLIRGSNVARERGDHQTAERLARQAIERNPGPADYWNVLGLALSGRAPREAAHAFERAVEQARRDPVYRLNLARENVILAERGDRSRVDAAAAGAHAAVSLDPNGVRTIMRASEIHLATGRPSDALQAARKARDLAPANPRTREWVARVLAATGELAPAAAELEQAMALEVEDPRKAPFPMRLRLAELYAQLGRGSDIDSLIARASIIQVDLDCVPRHGVIELGGVYRKRCFRVVYNFEVPLQVDGISSVTGVSAYRVGGQVLPPGTTIDFAAGYATVQLPADAVPPAPGAVVQVSGVRDRLGRTITPHPWAGAMP